MAQRKFKMTAFARFFLVMIVAAPLAYMGASYYNGQDGLQNIKDLFNGKIPRMESSNSEETAIDTETKPELPKAKEEPIVENSSTETSTVSETAINGEIAKLKDDLEYKDRRIKELYEEIEGLKAHLKEKDDAFADQAEKMKKIQDQLDLIKKAAGGE